MSEQQLLDVVRQYALASRRKRLSFAVQVNHFARERAKTINASGLTPEQTAAELKRMDDMLVREYGRDDGSFTPSWAD
jgi:hypothetical protein